MKYIQEALGSVLSRLSDEHYEQSFSFFRFWFEIAQTHSKVPHDLIFDAIYKFRAASSFHSDSIYQAAHLILRLVSDAESDPVLAPHSAGLRNRFCTKVLQQFFDEDLEVVYGGRSQPRDSYYMDANLIAHCANLGYMEEDTIRNHILQSLISHQKLYDHQADALIILFKIAGATFGAYADLAVVDRCFELLKKHQYRDRVTGCRRRVSAFSV